MNAFWRVGCQWMGRILGGAAGLSALAQSATAQELGADLKRFVHDDAVATIHLRSYFLDRTNPQPPNNAAWAGGGWIGYESGWLLNTLQVGAVGYTSQPLWVPPSTDGTLLLKHGQYGFFVLGQAYGSLKAGEQVFTGYRQLIDELEVNPNDDRMVPNTFEAYALRGKLGKVRYFAGYVAAMKPRDYSTFINMAERAGAPGDVTAGMWLGSVKYGSLDDLRLRASAYYVPDILTSSYGDVVWTVPMFEKAKLQLGSNLMVQGSNGLNLLTGTAFSTWSGGARADVVWGPAALSAVLHPDRQRRGLPHALRSMDRLYQSRSPRISTAPTNGLSRLAAAYRLLRPETSRPVLHGVRHLRQRRPQPGDRRPPVGQYGIRSRPQLSVHGQGSFPTG